MMKKMFGMIFLLVMVFPLAAQADIADNLGITLGAGMLRDNQAQFGAPLFLELGLEKEYFDDVELGLYLYVMEQIYRCSKDSCYYDSEEYKTAIGGGVSAKYLFNEDWAAGLKVGARHYLADSFDPGIDGDTFLEGRAGLYWKQFSAEILFHRFADSCNECNNQCRNYMSALLVGWTFGAGSKSRPAPLTPVELTPEDSGGDGSDEVGASDEGPPAVGGGGDIDPASMPIPVQDVPVGYKAYGYLLRFNPGYGGDGAIPRVIKETRETVGNEDTNRLITNLYELKGIAEDPSNGVEIKIVYVVGIASPRSNKKIPSSVNEDFSQDRMRHGSAIVKDVFGDQPFIREEWKVTGPTDTQVTDKSILANYEVCYVFVVVKDPNGAVNKPASNKIPAGIIPLLEE